MTCVECNRRIPTPTPDPFRCPECRQHHEASIILPLALAALPAAAATVGTLISKITTKK